MLFACLALVALLAEATFGYPDRLFAAMGHPVTWFGRLIEALDRRWNSAALSRGRRIAFGTVLTALLLLLATAIGIGLHGLAEALLPSGLALLVLGLLAAGLPAQRSLHRHVAAVRDALRQHHDLEPARCALARIVGRDTAKLSETDITRAAIESLAENFSDGIVAPAFWLVVGGLPGGLAYKAVSTADSMIGHRSKRYEAFGKAAARLDDLLNLPASRLSSLLIVTAALFTEGAGAGAAWRAVREDASRHASPNAGWPEAAMAGALGLALAGPRTYHGVSVDAAIMNPGGDSEARANDIDRALALYRRADALLIAIVAAAAFLLLL